MEFDYAISKERGSGYGNLYHQEIHKSEVGISVSWPTNGSGIEVGCVRRSFGSAENGYGAAGNPCRRLS